MPFKPNYRMQRADRQLAKQNKLQKKLQRRAEKGPDSDVPDQDSPNPGGIVETSGVDQLETKETGLPT
jgi:hypothetical protein